MSGLFRYFQRLLGRPQQTVKATGSYRRLDLTRFAEGDRLLVDGKRLTGPLQHGLRHNTAKGFVAHDDVIGRPAVRSIFISNVKSQHEVTYPNLDEYVSLTPRKVTPVYASYASLIVSLLDINIVHTQYDEPPIEILESGTGHGSLTLHLARAIAAANHTPSDDPEWRKRRRAILHTVEISPTVSTHAQKIVGQFRQGLYLPHIDFYVHSVAEWVDAQSKVRSAQEQDEGYLSYAVLDMPAVYKQISSVVKAMKHDALLAVFVPSVTQIGDCVKAIEENSLPLRMEKVVEMGEGISNGRIWDVRLVRPRKKWGEKQVDDKNVEREGSETESSDLEDVRITATAEDEDKSVFVCRPKVGRLTMGGGFVGMWRKVDTKKMG